MALHWSRTKQPRAANHSTRKHLKMITQPCICSTSPKPKAHAGFNQINTLGRENKMSRAEQIASQIAPQRSRPAFSKCWSTRHIKLKSCGLYRLMNPDRLARIALTEIRKTPAARRVRPVSLFGAYPMRAARPRTRKLTWSRLFAAISKHEKNRTDVQFIVGYRE